MKAGRVPRILAQMRSTPPWTGHRAAVDDRDRYAAMTPEERLAISVEVCELARTILEARPDLSKLPPAVAAAWERLVRERRGGRSSR